MPAAGRAFEWLPWVALSSPTVRPDVKPTLVDAIESRLIHHPRTSGAGRFIPTLAHAKGLGLELLGSVDLDPALVAPNLSKWRVGRAIQVAWTIAYGALSATPARAAGVRVALRSLLRDEIAGARKVSRP